MVDIDSETLFNAAAAIIATVAVLVFVLNVEFGYSPVSKILLVILFLAGVFTITQRTADHQLTLLGYGVIVVSVVALFFNVMNTFSVGTTLTVIGLLVIATILFGLRAQLDQDNKFVTGRQATTILGVIAILTIGVLVTDVITGGLTYELQPQSEIQITETRGEELRVASLLVSNPTPFPERVKTPNYAVCTAGNWSEYRRSPEDGDQRPPVQAGIHIQDGYNEHVLSFSAKTYPVLLHVEGGNIKGERFPVERTSSCPDTETGLPYIAIYEAPDNRHGIRAV